MIPIFRNAFLALLVSIVALSTMAASIGDLTEEEKEPTTSFDETSALQDDLVRQYTVAAILINQAQYILAEALGLKKDAASLQANVDALAGGTVLDKDALQKSTEISKRANKNIQKILREVAELSGDSKSKFGRAMVPYARGLYETDQLSDEFQAFAGATKAIIKEAPMMQKMKVKGKLSAGMYVTSKIPGFSKDLYHTSGSLLAFAEDHGIDVPKEATDFFAGQGTDMFD